MQSNLLKPIHGLSFTHTCTESLVTVSIKKIHVQIDKPLTEAALLPTNSWEAMMMMMVITVVALTVLALQMGETHSKIFGER